MVQENGVRSVLIVIVENKTMPNYTGILKLRLHSIQSFGATFEFFMQCFIIRILYHH